MKYLLDFKKWGILEQDSTDDIGFKLLIQKKLGVELDQKEKTFVEKEGFLSWSLYSDIAKRALGDNMKQIIGKALPVVKNTEAGKSTKDFQIKPDDIIPTEKIKALYYGEGKNKSNRVLYVFCKEQPVYKMSQLKKVYDEFGGSADINTETIKSEMGGKDSGNFYPYHVSDGGDIRKLPEWKGSGNPPANRLKVEGYDYLVDLSKTNAESFTVYKLDNTGKNVSYGTLPSSIFKSIVKEDGNLQEGDMEGVKIV
jgi:hypothetical protein